MTLATLFWVVATLAYEAPDGWIPQEASSRMRMAQWELSGDGEPAEVVLFFFGEGGGGGVEANLGRWYGQFTQPDGSSTEERAKVTEREVNGLVLTIVDIRGTYVAPVRPGARARNDNPDYRMISTVAEAAGGPWFIRVLGPEATVSKWEASIEEFLSSLRTH